MFSLCDKTCPTLLATHWGYFPIHHQTFPAFPTDCQFVLAAAGGNVIDFSFNQLHWQKRQMSLTVSDIST